MREILFEQSVDPSNLSKKKALKLILSILFYINMVLGVIFVIGSLYLYWAFIIFAPFSFLVCFLINYYVKKFYYCVDYIFVSGSVRIVKVVKFKYRRKIMVFDSKDIYQLGKVGSGSYDKLCETPGIKKVIATPNKRVEQAFYIALKQDGINYLVLLECKEEFLTHIVTFAGRHIIEKDYK